MTVDTHNNLYTALYAEMVRVDKLRLRVNRQAMPFVEFMMRRALLHGKHALHQRNAPEAERWWKVLFQFGRTSNECPR